MLFFAHRGASGEHPENTLKAIKAAIEMGADAIEIDVHRADSELIVIHDQWLHRTTNGTGNISDYSLSQLQQFDAGNGESIPTLWQVLQTVNASIDINIELKGEDTVPPTLAMIQRAITELGYQESQFLISSFNHHLLHQVKQQQPQLKTGALTACIPLNYAEFAAKLDAYSINIDVSFINQAYVDNAHQRGLKVYVYTVDQQQDIKRMYQMGVDGIFTNYPAQSKSLWLDIKNNQA